MFWGTTGRLQTHTLELGTSLFCKSHLGLKSPQRTDAILNGTHLWSALSNITWLILHQSIIELSQQGMSETVGHETRRFPLNLQRRLAQWLHCTRAFQLCQKKQPLIYCMVFCFCKKPLMSICCDSCQLILVFPCICEHGLHARVKTSNISALLQSWGNEKMS